MKIQTKLIFFLTMVMLVFIIVFGIQINIEHKRLNSLFNERKNEEGIIFDKVLEAKSKPLQTLAFDYSYRDEMVNFIQTDDKVWAEKMFEKSVLANYKVNAIWIYKTNLSLAYSINNLKDDEFKEMPLSKEVFKKVSGQLLEEHFCHFFMNSPQGLMEVCGAIVHPSGDVQRKTPGQGYFFTGRLWNKDYIAELSQLTGAKLVITPITKEGFKDDVTLGIITFSRIITGWDKNPLLRLNVQIESKSIRYFSQTSQKELFLFLISVIAILIFKSVYLRRIVSRPLQLISSTLTTEDTAYIDNLKKTRTEFGDISRLIFKSFEQRANLAKEITAHKELEARLTKINECFLSLGPDSEENINRLTFLCGELLDATCCLYNRLDKGLLISAGQWNIPADYNFVDKPEGHICYDVIKRGTDEVFVVRNLAQTPYAKTDPNVALYNLQTYIGVAVKCHDTIAGALCVDYQKDFSPSDADKKTLGIIASAIGVEEERHLAQEELKNAYDKLKETESQLIQSAKMASVGQLAGGLAHEINNPLTGVLNNIQLIRGQIGQGGQLDLVDFKEILGSIEESALRCKNIVRSLLDFSRSSRGPFIFISLNEVIEKAVSLIGPEIQSEKIVLQKQFQPDLPQILGNSQLLQQAIFNIISNAGWAIQKSKKESGIITIETQYASKKNAVLLSISDTGIGIPKENLGRIFEPFFTTKPPGEGTGLGLSIVYNIIKEHKGSIEVESQINKGTTFKISFPCILEMVDQT